ncbi:MAG: immunoglobulin domain-containing protein, partial [Limisphaerales bacterium]
LGTYDTVAFQSWTNIQVSVPLPAQTSSTMLRWRQLSHSGNSFDHWAIDDVQVASASPPPGVPPTITSQPQSLTVEAGNVASFNVAASGTLPITYQWRFNDNALTGATNQVLSLTNIDLTHSGSYSVLVSNAYGSALSSNALLTVTPASDITINAFDSGWYSSSGLHSPGNRNYIVGHFQSASSTPPFRNWFVFQIPSFSGSLVSASLRIRTYGMESPQGTETDQLRHVSTSISNLVAGGSGLTNIYLDLGDGPVYGTRVFTPADASQYVTIPLNATLLTNLTIARGGMFAIGGEITTLETIPGSNETIFSSSAGVSEDIQLLLNVQHSGAALTHFAWSPIPSAQEAGSPFNITLLALDASNQVVQTFSGPVSVAAILSGGLMPTVTPGTISNFTNGIWSGNVIVHQAATNVSLVASNVLGTFGQSEPFTVVPAFIRTISTTQHGTNLVLSWSGPLGNYILEYSDDLTSTNWHPVTNSPILTSGQVIATDSLDATNRFYRLRKP